MVDSEKEMEEVSARVQQGTLPVSCIDTCRQNFKVTMTSLRKQALDRLENSYIKEARGPSVCWRLMRSLSRNHTSPDIPPMELRSHFSSVYSKPGHPTLLWYGSPINHDYLLTSIMTNESTCLSLTIAPLFSVI